MPDPGEPGADSPGPVATSPSHPVIPVRSGPPHPGHQARIRLDVELTAARAELGRVDATTATLLGTAGVLLGLGSGLAAVAHVDRLPVVIVLAAAAAAVLLGVAVVLLGAAIHPRLDHDHGFVRWARLTPQALLDDLDERGEASPLAARARELIWVSRSLLVKSTLIRRAVPLIVAGLVLTGIAAGAAVVITAAVA